MSAVKLIKAPLSGLQLVLWTHDHPMWRCILIMPTLMAQSERKKEQRPIVKYSSCCRGVIKYAMFVSAVDVTNSRRSASPGSLSLEEIVLPLNVRSSEECSLHFMKKKSAIQCEVNAFSEIKVPHYTFPCSWADTLKGSYFVPLVCNCLHLFSF